MRQPLVTADSAKQLDLNEAIELVPGGIISKSLLEIEGLKMVLFSMDAGQEISPHRAPFPATIQVWEGKVRVKVSGIDHELGPNGWLVMPADVIHELHAIKPTRFLLTLVKGKNGA